MPLCIDLFCGLGGWTEGFLSEGWDVIGFDNERHVYPQVCPMCKGTGVCNSIPDCLICNRAGTITQRYPAQLVLQDVLTLHGRQFKDIDCIVASPPCQEFSYMAMPWSRAKQIAAALREEVPFPEGYTGSRTVPELRALFDACFRIQQEAREAAGRHIPMVVENVKGAQPWVGPAKANFGSFYLWGDVGMVGGAVVAGPLQSGNVVRAARRTRKQAGRNFHFPEKYGIPSPSFHGAEHEESVAAALEIAATKNGGGSWFDVAHNTESGTGQNPVNGVKPRPGTGVKNARNWWSDGEGSLSATTSSRSSARKAASAQIAKIPFPLSSYIARALKPATIPAQPDEPFALSSGRFSL